MFLIHYPKIANIIENEIKSSPPLTAIILWQATEVFERKTSYSFKSVEANVGTAIAPKTSAVFPAAVVAGN